MENFNGFPGRVHVQVVCSHEQNPATTEIDTRPLVGSLAHRRKLQRTRRGVASSRARRTRENSSDPELARTQAGVGVGRV
jgi:hypothetical protein